MAGIALDRPVHSFFADGAPATTLAPDFVERLAEKSASPSENGPREPRKLPIL
jgi:hypothetical protein